MRKPAFLFSILCFLLLMVVRTKPPGPWAQTQLLLSYDDGFSRRALLGWLIELVQPAGLDEATARMICLIVTFAGGLAFMLYVLRALEDVPRAFALGAVVATSFGLAEFLGNTGYLEGAYFVPGLIALALPGAGLASGAAMLALGAVGVLIHDAMLPSFGVLIALLLFLRWQGRGPGRAAGVAAVPLVALVVLSAALFKLSPSGAEAETLIAGVSARALDYPIDPKAVEAVLRYGPGEGPSYLFRWETPFFYFERNYVLPIGFGFLALASVLIWRLGAGLGALARLACVLAALAPATLMLVAFDLSRLMGFAVLQAILVIAILLREHPPAREALPRLVTEAWVVALMAANVFVSWPAFNRGGEYSAHLPAGLIETQRWGLSMEEQLKIPPRQY
ncbi:hypothetical protein [Pseudothioclava arenosa]|nr:hypothetical protein [Pseudothioclava arenosa]